MILILKLSDIYLSIMVLLSLFQKFIIAQGGDVVCWKLIMPDKMDESVHTVVFKILLNGFLCLLVTCVFCRIMSQFSVWDYDAQLEPSLTHFTTHAASWISAGLSTASHLKRN